MLKDQVIAQLHLLTRVMMEAEEFDMDELIDGMEIETPNFVLKVEVQLGEGV